MQTRYDPQGLLIQLETALHRIVASRPQKRSGRSPSTKQRLREHLSQRLFGCRESPLAT